MDTQARGPQAVSGKQNLTHQILWFREGPKNRESSGLRISAQKYFLRFFITALPKAWGALWISESHRHPRPVAANGRRDAGKPGRILMFRRCLLA